MKSKSRNYLFLLIFFVTFLLIFLLNHKTLYISDDFLYKFEFKPGFSADIELNPVNGFRSLIRSQYYHYHIWNGRFVAHTIVQFFMQFDKWIFNVFNTLIFLILGWLIVEISRYVTEKDIKVMPILLVYILMFLSIPNFGQTVLWLSGSVNYMWMSVIYLGFYFFNIKLRKDSVTSIVVATFLGFLAGATNENTGPATILMVICLAFYQFYKEKKVSFWRISGIVSSSFGFSLILFAPAATKRVAERNEVSLSIGSIIENIDQITQYIIENYMIYLVLMVFLFLVLYTNKRLSEKIILNTSILFIGFLASTYSLVAVDIIIERTMFGPTIFIITILLILAVEFFDYINNTKSLILAFTPLLALFIYVYSYAFTDISQTYTQLEDQYEIILNNPGQDVTVPSITPPENDYNAYSNGTNYLREDRKTWLNKWAAKFFGVNSIGGNP